MSNKIRRKKRKSVSQRRSNQIKADYNSLEQRLALTTFVVTSLGDGIVDDGLVTLREAVTAANTNAASGDAAAGEATGDIIRFDASLIGGTINLTEGQLTISDDVAIQGGPLDITIDAQGLSRAFEITSSETVSLGRINVTGGNADIGGGVLATGSGNLVVFGGEYSANVATGVGGGAIYSGLTNNLFVIGGTSFDGNVATGDSGSGGAIFNLAGTAVANDAVFTANTANRAGGAIEIAGGDLFLNNIEADGNIAGPDGVGSPGNGGVLHVTAGDLVAVNDSVITNNIAALEGGGLWNQAGTTLIVNNTTFANNIAEGDAANDGGGAIFNNGGFLAVNAGVFDDNAATGTAGSGGAIFSVDGRVLIQDSSEFSNNVSSRAGGAIELIDGQFFDTGSTYTANDTGVSQPASPGNGGAFHITGTGLTSFNGTQFVDNAAGSEGGAVWNSADASVFLTNVTFTGNVASGNDADNGGGALFNNGGQAVVNGSTFNENIADGTAGSGGAIFSVDGRVLVVNESSFTENISARAGGAVEIIDGEFFDNDSSYLGNNTGVSLTASPGNGGAFHITGDATAAFTGTEFLDNLAGSEGGAVWNSATSTTFLRNVDIINNVASGDGADNGGGGIFNNGGSVFVNSSTVSGNQADGAAGSGGGALSVDGVLRFDNSTIDSNLASRAGGGVEVIDGRAVFNTATLTSNTTGVTLAAAPGNGGALHVTGNSTAVTFSDSTISGNSAANQGGGLWNQAGSSLFLDSNTTVSDNSTLGLGGGVYNRGFLAAVDSAFSNNTAEDDGGAIYVTDTGRTRIEDSSLLNNVAADDGGGVFNAGNVFTLGSTYQDNSAAGVGGAIFTVPEAILTIGLDNFFAGNSPSDQN